jgi:hypothetical protein
MTIIVQSMGIPSVELHFRRRIYPEVHLLAKLFRRFESTPETQSQRQPALLHYDPRDL